jgi:hypothetical protein
MQYLYYSNFVHISFLYFMYDISIKITSQILPNLQTLVFCFTLVCGIGIFSGKEYDSVFITFLNRALQTISVSS